MDSAIFKAYDIRGIYPDQIDDEGAWKIGSATAQFLRSLLTGYERGQANMQSLCVGRDMRTHSPAVAKALIKGMNSTGANVIDIGMIDTPQMYFAINHLGTCGGVQVTASHNPAKYNGFKISGLQAKPVGADTGLKDIQHIAMAMPHTKGKATGSLEKRDLTDEYKNHVLKFLRPSKVKLKIAIDASNGMAGKIVPAVFGNLPVEIIPINFKHDGTFKHEPNPLVEKNLAEVKEAVLENGCHFGLCFDGDADRLMMVDEKGRTVTCDLMTALIAPYLQLGRRRGDHQARWNAAQRARWPLIYEEGHARFSCRLRRRTVRTLLLPRQLLRRFGYDHSRAYIEYRRSGEKTHQQADQAASEISRQR